MTEIALGVAKRRCPEPHETLDVPLLQERFVGVQENREIEKIGNERNLLAFAQQPVRQEHVQPLDDENVGPVDHDLLARHHVVDEMRIDRRAHMRVACLHVGEEADQSSAVVAFRKATTALD